MDRPTMFDDRCEGRSVAERMRVLADYLGDCRNAEEQPAWLERRENVRTYLTWLFELIIPASPLRVPVIRRPFPGPHSGSKTRRGG